MSKQKIWDEKWECADRDTIKRQQLARLQETVAYAYEKVPLYKARLDEAGIRPTDIRCLEDIKLLPFTTKKDFHDSYPFGMFAVPPQELIRIHSSSGTTGKPTVVGYTKNDLNTWTELLARMVTQAGVTDRDIAQISFGYGMFTGAFGLHYGLERVGATVVPISSGNTDRQLMFMADFKTTALISTPSYAAHLAEQAKNRGITIGKDTCLHWGLFGSEPWTEGMRCRVQESLGLSATDNYGMSELGGPGFSGECECVKDGMHISEDLYIWEIINPITCESVPEGEIGELVVTPLWKEALPILRYRTRDLTAVTTAPCACGRTTARMSRVKGRTDDMLIIRGVNVFPTQVEHVLMQTEGTSPHYLLVVKRDGALDTLEVWVEMSEKLFAESQSRMSRVTDLQSLLSKKIHSVLGLSVKIKLVEPQTLERSKGKAKRVQDLRNQD
ncbi:MAG TPA: phenylacetate--CoA ligase [Armatimonadota bacterium]|nr:phenylacetate--CoA ligase [Armatimonadota bacterium]